MLQMPTNKQIQAEVFRTIVACNMINRKCKNSDMVKLEKYLKNIFDFT